MANMADIDPPPPTTPERNTDDEAEVESVSDSESVTTEDVYELLTPKNKPAVRAQVYLDLPAWFIVLTSYVFALGLGVFSSNKC